MLKKIFSFKKKPLQVCSGFFYTFELLTKKQTHEKHNSKKWSSWRIGSWNHNDCYDGLHEVQSTI
jgi:hypothetical protein